MHVPDGFVSPLISLPALAACAPLWGWAARRHLGASAVESLPIVGALTALAFVVQSLAIPVPGGTSTHLVGVMLLALLYDPLLAFLCESLVLIVEVLFLGEGGVTVIGVNALAMGLLGPLCGWLAWKALRRLSEGVALFAAGWISTQVSTLAVAGVLALQHLLDPGYLPTPPTVLFAAMAVPSLVVSGVVEGLYTVFALSLVRRAGFRGAQG